jgi:hypothetical protein
VLDWTRRCCGDVLAGVGRLSDAREQPGIPAGRVAKTIFAMTLARMGRRPSSRR